LDKPILILGSGITGVTAATSLAQLGHQVYLVDQNDSLGGKMLDLGFVYPTDDCSLCHESSFSHGFDSHRKCQYRSFIPILPGVNFLHSSELIKLDINGNEQITAVLSQKPKFIDPDKCVACGACAKACPLGAIALVHPQNIPKVYVLYSDICDTTRCKKECLETCKDLGAIDLGAKSQQVNVDAAAMLVATGFDEKCPPHIDDLYAWSRSDRVISQLELGQMLDPIRGKKEFLKRNIRNILIIQCTGSRDKRYKLECSSLCCSYALKHAMNLKNLNMDVTIAYIDIRTLGDMEGYFAKARNKGIKFIRGHPSSVQIDKEGNVSVDVENALTGDFKSLHMDLVVLSNPLELSKNNLLNQQDGHKRSNVFFLNEELRNIPQSTRAAKSVALEIHQSVRG
jgi:heterodisulfide reductase subunit A